MSELKEFTAEDMRGCPRLPFVSDIDNRLASFENSNGRYIQITFMRESYSIAKIMCKPLDRCHAICKHLFDVMPSADTIQINPKYKRIEIVDLGCHKWLKLSINPFLHTDLTSITREELGL